MNTVVAVNNKIIEKYILKKMPTVGVLSTIRRRSQVIDTVLSRNPHMLILSSALSGNIEMREIISKIRKLKPTLKIVYLYGERDNEHKAFLDFLVRQSIYDIILDEINEDNLKSAILENANFDDVKSYLLTPDEAATMTTIEKIQPETVKPENTATLKVLVVEKYIGNITIAVGSLFPRSGCTHTAIEMCKYLSANKCDVGIVINTEILAALKAYYLIEDDAHNIKSCMIYDNLELAKQKHKTVIIDMGYIADKQKNFYGQSLAVLLCPAAPWEIDKLTGFIKENDFAAALHYLLYPVSDNRFYELSKNMKQGGCKCYKTAYSPEPFSSTANYKMFAELLKSVCEQTKKM